MCAGSFKILSREHFLCGESTQTAVSGATIWGFFVALLPFTIIIIGKGCSGCLSEECLFEHLVMVDS
jgi:hypothetical protein